MVALMGLGMAVFAVKDHQVVAKCPTSCTLFCNKTTSFLSTKEECHIAYISGGIACFSALLIIFILFLRVCAASRM